MAEAESWEKEALGRAKAILAASLYTWEEILHE